MSSSPQLATGSKANILWYPVKRLEGKHVTTVSGKKFRIYKVTDSDVQYDPLETESPGTHLTYKNTLVRFAEAIQSGSRRAPENLKQLSALREELGIADGHSDSYIFGIRCAIGLLRHQKARKVSDI